jgi:hypothetical protein
MPGGGNSMAAIPSAYASYTRPAIGKATTSASTYASTALRLGNIRRRRRAEFRFTVSAYATYAGRARLIIGAKYTVVYFVVMLWSAIQPPARIVCLT